MYRATNRKFAILAVALILALVYVVWADTGQVIDGTTGKPLAGVHVVATWSGSAFAGITSKQVCFKVEATRSAENGRFEMSASSWNFNPLLSDRTRMLTLYKRGYVAPVLGPDDSVSPAVMMPDDRIGLERIKYIGALASGTGCGDMQQQRIQTLSLHRDVYEETRDLAKTAEERRWLNSALAAVEVLEIGQQKAGDNFERREREWGLK